MRGSKESQPDSVESLERHIIAVSMGRVRLGLNPDQLEKYIAEQYSLLLKMRGENETQ